MLICLDIETTGLSPDRDKIIEIGAALVNLKTRKIEAKYKTFVNPGVPIPHSIIHLTGITDKDTEKAPKLKDIKEELLKFVRDHPIMGHNINFDLDFLAANGIRPPGPRLDSMDISHIALPREHSYSLEIIANKFDIPDVGQHRALKDAEVNIDLMFQLFDLYFSKNEEKIPQILEILKKSDSPWKNHLIEASKNFKKVPPPEEKKSLPTKSSILNPTPNTITELYPYTLEDLIPEKPETKTIVVTPHPPEDNPNVILNANQYIDEKLFQKLLKKKTLTPEETTFALKILPLPHPVSRADLTIPRELKDLFFNHTCQNYPKEIEKQLEESQIILMNHGTLAHLSFQKPDLLKNTHLIIDQIDELYENAQFALTSIYTEKRFMNSQLPEKIKDRLLILFGYLGIMVQKYGDAFGLEFSSYHFSTIDWQKTEDVIEKIALDLEEVPDSEEKHLLIWLAKAIKDTKNTKTTINLTHEQLPILKTIPLNVGEVLEAKIWALPENLTLISPAITYEKEETPGAYLKKLLYLPKDFNVDIQTKKPPKITTKQTFPNPKEAIFSEKADQELLKSLPKLEGLTYILTGSQNSALQIHQKIALPLKNDHNFRVLAQKASGGMGKIKKLSQGNPDKTVVIGTYDFWKFAQPEITNLIIYRIPFPPPSRTPHKFVRNPFQEYTIPETSLKLKKIALTAKKTVCFDSRLGY